MTTPNIYDLGDLVTLTGRFFSDAGLTTPADPTSVVLSIRNPARVITMPSWTKVSTGVYTYSWIPSISGLHEVNWTGTGAIVSADQEAIFVKVGIALGTDLCSVDEVKMALEITSSSDDGIIPQLITAASQAIQDRYQREFANKGTLTRRFDVDQSSRIVSLDPFDLYSVTSAVLYGESTTPLTIVQDTDFQLRPVGTNTLGTYTSLRLSDFLVVIGQNALRFGVSNLDITGVWGAQSIPASVNRACILTVASWRDRAVNEYAIQGIETGRDMTPDQFTTYAIPSAAHRLLQPFERMTYQ